MSAVQSKRTQFLDPYKIRLTFLHVLKSAKHSYTCTYDHELTEPCRLALLVHYASTRIHLQKNSRCPAPPLPPQIGLYFTLNTN